MSETDYNERLEETSQMTVEAMDEYFDVDETTEKVVNIESGVSKTAKQVPDKYVDGTGLSEDDFVPNTNVNDVVENVLEFIDEHGLPNPDAQREGASRANQIHDHFVNDEPLGYEYWEEIYNFHQRHRAQGNHECDESSIAESDKKEINQNEHDVCFFDNGYFSDHTWGSDAGYEQAERIVTAVEDAGVEKQWSPYEGPQGGFGWTDGEEVVYQEEPPGPVDVSNLTDEQVNALEDELGQSLTDNDDSLDTEARVEESVDIEQVENPVFVDSQQIKDSLTSMVERTKQDEVADNLLENLDSVKREDRGGAYYSGAKEFVNLPADSTDGSMHHELGHALLGSNGSKSRSGATLISRLYVYDRNFADSLDPSDLIGQSPSTLSFTLANNTDIDIESFPNFQNYLEEDVSRDTFRIDVPDDTSEEMQNLVRELNDAWERQFDNYGEVYIQDAYSASNAHETMARLHEHLQNPGINYNVMDDLIEDFPDLLEAYIEVIEPNDNQMRYLEEEGFL